MHVCIHVYVFMYVCINFVCIHVGGRGIVMEIWEQTGNSACTLDVIEKKNISFPNGGNYTIIESTCLNSNDYSLVGELSNSFIHLFGLFCPPDSSLYTFNIQSTGPTRLYLSPNSSFQYKQVVASTPSSAKGWNSYQEQTSQPIWLESDKCYYMEVVSALCSSSWKVCFRAKMHSLDWTKSKANADHEVQLINISSAATNETQVILHACKNCML